MGNWSAPNTRFHEPVRGLGFSRLLKKLNPRNVSMVNNTRPHRRRVNPRVIRHGLLRAMTRDTNRILPRLWNRNMDDWLTMVDIVRSVRAGNDIPPPLRFRRGEASQDQRKRARTQNNQANIRNVCQRHKANKIVQGINPKVVTSAVINSKRSNALFESIDRFQIFEILRMYFQNNFSKDFDLP
ncbi:uncharacterized protein EV154DRAFT_588095 [Mucor mucedo]|uniref:uncharacterized protein n=1 Tax=Mucor mucedo TaxID=29922 RepID=UPI00221F6076|nr:uncharacterized protein EV154DRAFT_588095 [Mucor mucedo]KAI7862832.1 hypothetical protein EV154DRAFT_588095 [Mucor mucedo]